MVFTSIAAIASRWTRTCQLPQSVRPYCSRPSSGSLRVFLIRKRKPSKFKFTPLGKLMFDSVYARHSVETVLKMCGLEKFADAIVGSLGVEHKKRTTIGVELAAKPKLLLFLDEPTSGLDSQSAWAIMRFLRSLADRGQAILCTYVLSQSFLYSCVLNTLSRQNPSTLVRAIPGVRQTFAPQEGRTDGLLR